MNRRAFLAALGLAPVVVPMVAKAVPSGQNAPASQIDEAFRVLMRDFADGKVIGYGSGTSQGTVICGEISTAGSMDYYGAPFAHNWADLEIHVS